MLSVVKLIERSGRGWRTDQWCPGLRGWFDYKEAAQGRLDYAISSLCWWLPKSMHMLKPTECISLKKLHLIKKLSYTLKVIYVLFYPALPGISGVVFGLPYSAFLPELGNFLTP